MTEKRKITKKGDLVVTYTPKRTEKNVRPLGSEASGMITRDVKKILSKDMKDISTGMGVQDIWVDASGNKKKLKAKVGVYQYREKVTDVAVDCHISPDTRDYYSVEIKSCKVTVPDFEKAKKRTQVTHYKYD